MTLSALPPVPPPPSFGPDSRQETFYRTAGCLGAELSKEGGEVHVAATATGYPASAVDLGRLQAEIELALAGLSIDEIRARWSDEVLPWLAAFTRVWVQRRKALHAEIREKGVALTIEAQDDAGYYTYTFDIFPGRPHTDRGR